MYAKWERQIRLNGNSLSTLTNYGRCIAKLALHFQRLPFELEEEEINAYLLYCRDNEGKSKSYFKHTVYGLRNLCKMLDRETDVKLPQIKRLHIEPVVLNKSELKLLFKTPQLFKHRILLTLTYACGLRIREITRLRVRDIDFERRQIHIRQSKYWKDRYVTLSDYMAKNLQKYLSACHPKDYLFEGNSPTGGMSIRGIQWVMRQVVKESGIQKDVSMHTLRHTFATHAIENGQNIFRLKQELGHARIETTMVYLHVAHQPDEGKFQSPFDTLYEGKI